MTDHESMLACECQEADRLMRVCLSCGRVFLPDPTWYVVILAGAYLGYELARYAWGCFA